MQAYAVSSSLTHTVPSVSLSSSSQNPMSTVFPHTATTHLPYSPFHQFKTRPLCFLPPQPPPTLWSHPLCLDSLRIRDCPRILLHRNGLLARAEDKARGGSSSTSSTQQQPSSDKQFQVLMFCVKFICTRERSHI